MGIYHVRLQSTPWLIVTMLYRAISWVTGLCVFYLFYDSNTSWFAYLIAVSIILLWPWILYVLAKLSRRNLEVTIDPDKIHLVFVNQLFFQKRMKQTIHFNDIARYKQYTGERNHLILKLKNGTRYRIIPYSIFKKIEDYSTINFQEDLQEAYIKYSSDNNIITHVNKTEYSTLTDILEIIAIFSE